MSLCFGEAEGLLIKYRLYSVSPRRHYLLFSTKNPSTIQKMPWPVDEEFLDYERPVQSEYGTWIVNEEDFDWLVESEGEAVNDLCKTRVDPARF